MQSVNRSAKSTPPYAATMLITASPEIFGVSSLERPVRDGRNPEGALFRLTGLGDIDPPNVRRAIPLAVDGLEHRLDPFFKALLRRRYRLAIHPGGRTLWNL